MPILTPNHGLNVAKSKDNAVPQPGSDGISSLVWSPTADYLLSTNWDSTVSLWDVRQSGSQISATPQAQVFHESNNASLCACFSSDGKSVISGGVDKAVRFWDLESGFSNGVHKQIGVHEAPVSAVAFVSSTNLVATGSWDKTVKFWDNRSNKPCHVLKMPERVYAMDCRGKMLAVGTADNQISLYDVSSFNPRSICSKPTLSEIDKLRCVAISPDEKTIAVGGIAGKTMLYDCKNGLIRRTRIIKSHLRDNMAFSVNSVCFKGQSSDILAMGGNDGKIQSYKLSTKNHLKTIGPASQTISCAAFNTKGNLLAYASSYDWSKGSANAQKNDEIFIHIDEN